MKKFLLFFLIAASFTMSAGAQVLCGFDTKMDQLKKANPAYARELESTEQYIRSFVASQPLNAKKALSIPVPDESVLKGRKQKRDSVFLPFIRLIFGLKKAVVPGEEKEETQDDMLETELMQLSISDREIQQLLDNPDTDSIIWMNKEQQKQLALLVLKNPDASNALKEKMQKVLAFIE